MAARDGLILVTEDDDLLRNFVSEVLKSAGFNTVGAANGDSALVLLSEDMSIHTLFTDIVLPGSLDGFDVARRGVVIRPGLKVLYTSGFPDRLQGRTAELLGPFLPKPYLPQRLILQMELLFDPPD